MFPAPKDRCLVCGLAVYLPEKLMTKGMSFHRGCFKCSRGGCSLSLKDHAMLNGDLYCNRHMDEIRNQTNDTIKVSDADLRAYVNKTGCDLIFALPEHVYNRGQPSADNAKTD